MKILLLGANGQVGTELQRTLLVLGELKSCTRAQANLEDLQGLRSLIQDYQPNIIVNAAAYTAVDQAESDKDKAELVNTDAVGVMAHEAKDLDAWLIHYSTDYVFDGEKLNAYVESDPTSPINIYGNTKCKGEELITSSGCKHLIFRTSWVYGSHGNNFAKTMIRLFQEKDELSVVNDQIGVPTSAELIADVTSACLMQSLQKDTDLSGVYHLAPNGNTSWYGFAEYLCEKGKFIVDGMSNCSVGLSPIATLQYPTPAKRPENSLLNTNKISQAFGVFMPMWQVHVDRFLNQTYGD
ncbi:MAG: dTDP-4-dehydrorhamnose reductase [Candidatus Ruthia sp.]|jgi:dTDP-4-dehydrorhamnose reductase|nr:dTDP-4-dehydrorhamnose reductase [Candidatus Ruthturnera sp.]